MRRFFFLLLVVLGGCQSASWRRPETEPFKTALWYWSSPMQLSPKEVADLGELKADRLLVRSFTLSYDGDKVVPILGQRFVSSVGAPPLVLVANLDAGMVRHFREADAESMLEIIVKEFQLRQKRAEGEGYRVIGWQLDFDVPTSQLSKYASLLEGVRKQCKSELSISGLQTWMTSSELSKLLQPLDAWYPQFYEGDLPESPTDSQSLSNLSQSAAKAASFGKPFWIGVATYSSAIAFDPAGKRMGVVRGISANDAGNRFEERSRWNATNGESGIAFRVTSGPKKDWALRFSVPNLPSVRQDLELARKLGARGVALFRYPANNDRTALRMPTLAAVIKGDAPRIEITASPKIDRIPVFAQIEDPSAGGDGGLSSQIRKEFMITNTGNVDSGPLTVSVSGETPYDIVNAGDFRAIVNRRMFRIAGLAPGESVRFGPVINAGDHFPTLTLSYSDAKQSQEAMILK